MIKLIIYLAVTTVGTELVLHTVESTERTRPITSLQQLMSTTFSTSITYSQAMVKTICLHHYQLQTMQLSFAVCSDPFCLNGGQQLVHHNGKTC